MASLSWEFQDGRDGGHYVANYRGLVIEAHRDETPENPFEAWDCEPPLAVRFDHDLADYSKGDALDPFGGLPDAFFSRNWRKIAAAMDLDPIAFDRDCRDDQGKGDALAYVRRDHFERALDDIRPGRDGYGFTAAAETIAALWRLRGVEALTATSRGYSQGDWAELLIVATPAWADKVGAPRDSHARQLAGAVKLYGAWAWGAVYGYVVKGPDGAELDEVDDSCWGFYGDDFAESGLEEQAVSAAGYIADELRERLAGEIGAERKATLALFAERRGLCAALAGKAQSFEQARWLLESDLRERFANIRAKRETLAALVPA